MKLTDNEKRIAIAALSIALAKPANNARWHEYTNLRKKFENARQS